QLCVVFREELQCWCRAVVQSVRHRSDGCRFGCFLVDYGRHCFVKLENIRIPLQMCEKLPYRAKKCGLYCVKPLTLHIDFCEGTAKIGPAKKWDTAAIRRFQNLIT
ncbi:TDR12 helicase, partial [Formicarius rufipectus]|nr:TDR12 helicase [Formicarius rufipectus]